MVLKKRIPSARARKSATATRSRSKTRQTPAAKSEAPYIPDAPRDNIPWDSPEVRRIILERLHELSLTLSMTSDCTVGHPDWSRISAAKDIIRATTFAMASSDGAFLDTLAVPARAHLRGHDGEVAEELGVRAHGGFVRPSRPAVAAKLARLAQRKLEENFHDGFDGAPACVRRISQQVTESLLYVLDVSAEEHWEVLRECTRRLPTAGPSFDVDVVDGAIYAVRSIVVRAGRKPDLEDMSRSIVRRVLSALGYPEERAKSLFDEERRKAGKVK